MNKLHVVLFSTSKYCKWESGGFVIQAGVHLNTIALFYVNSCIIAQVYRTADTMHFFTPALR